MAERRVEVAANPDAAYEKADWPIAKIGLVALVIVAFLVVAPLVLLLVFPGAVPDVGRGLTVEPPLPRLQIDAAGDLARFRAQEDRRLSTYYWIDRERGLVHIPIELAIKKVVEEGIDGFPGAGR